MVPTRFWQEIGYHLVAIPVEHQTLSKWFTEHKRGDKADLLTSDRRLDGHSSVSLEDCDTCLKQVYNLDSCWKQVWSSKKFNLNPRQMFRQCTRLTKIICNYHPQSLGQCCFSTCLWFCSQGEYLGRYPLGRYTPREVHPLGKYTPRQVQPPGNACWDTVNKQVVCILLKFILVKFNHQTLIPLIFKTYALDLIGPLSHMTELSLIGRKYMASNWPFKSHD